ncbi:hypothetical protein SteCoe_24143 [Stentor coeruleus]|uniref:Dickkopf N-terminal cysteine-rich domain-containing protein n=1 Tax=Stentor coeruleus TaxID=5963 RepID=A0A1R2BI66_9CILI|nr:hypothetical protein SteCoe_24143 [Stentor coeruleus]
MIFFLSLLSTALSNTCPVHDCSLPETLGQCLSYSNSTGIDTYNENPCQAGYYCYTNETTSAFCFPPKPNTRYPGEICFSNTDCISKNCNLTSNSCTGNVENAACLSSADCNPGLYCINQTNPVCKPQVAIGNKCNITEECYNFANCDNNICVEYFSLLEGNVTTVILPPNFAPSCYSGYANSTSNGFLCTDAPYNVSTTPVSCEMPSKCWDRKNQTYKNCQCGLDGNGYCPLFEGSNQVQSMISQWQWLIPGPGVPTCHTLHRFAYECYVGLYNETLLTMYLKWAENVNLYFHNTWVLSANATSCQEEFNIPYYVNVELQLKTTLPTCPIYYYTAENISESYQCYYNNTNVFHSDLVSVINAYGCSEGYYCPGGQNDNVNCTAIVTKALYPGQHCNTSAQCLSGSCKTVCLGKKVNEACKNNADCNPGLFCNTTNMTCKPVMTLGSICGINAPCSATLICDNFKCIKPFSLQINSVTTTGNSQYALACNSGYAEMIGGNYICATAPMNPYTIKTCLGENDCKSTLDYSSCQCGFNGIRYCSSAPGDVYFVNAKKAYLNLVGKECNLAMGVSPGCFESDMKVLLQYYYYYTNFTYFQMLPWLQDPLGPITSMYTADYWTSYKEMLRVQNNIPHSKSFGSIVSMGIILFIAFISL